MAVIHFSKILRRKILYFDIEYKVILSSVESEGISKVKNVPGKWNSEHKSSQSTIEKTTMTMTQKHSEI